MKINYKHHHLAVYQWYLFPSTTDYYWERETTPSILWFMMIHSIGLCNTFISQFPPTQPPEMLAAVRPQGHPKTRLYWPTPGYSGTNHLWEPSLEKQQHGCFRVSPPNPPTKKKTGACGMCVFFMFFCVGIFLCIYIYNEIFMLFAHRLWEKNTPGN